MPETRNWKQEIDRALGGDVGKRSDVIEASPSGQAGDDVFGVVVHGRGQRPAARRARASSASDLRT